jgi:hypothetical protein
LYRPFKARLVRIAASRGDLKEAIMTKTHRFDVIRLGDARRLTRGIPGGNFELDGEPQV